MKKLFTVNKQSLLSAVKYFIGWPLSAVALFFVLKIVASNASKALLDIKEINLLFMSLSIVLFIAYFFLRAYLWKYLLAEKGKQFSFKENILNWSTSELKRYVPGNIWSFLSRASVFERENLSKKEILILIAQESVIISLASLLMSLFFVFNSHLYLPIKYLILGFSFLCIVIFLFHSNITRALSIGILKKLFGILIPQNSYFTNLKILFLGIFTFALFGLGTYFSISSVFYLDPRNILVLLSLFNFSFFIGYVSLITPMGLGVREGTMTYALAQFLATSSAAVASIFTRVIFIISELFALLIVVIWNKTKNNYLQSFENFIFKNRYIVLLAIFVSIYIFYYSVASILRYDNFYTGRFDLGNMDQTVWNTIHGRVFQLTNPDGTQTISRLSVHADFILILISPLYLIWANPKMLLLLQTVVLGAGAFFVYFISKEVLKNKTLSLVFSLAYLLSPAVGYVNLYDFHPIALATTLLLAAFYFFLKRRYIVFLIFMFLAGTTKEEVWILASVFGIFLLARSYFEKSTNRLKEIMLGVFLTIAGVTTSYLLIDKIIPLFKGGNHFALSYYSDFGGSTLDIVKTILFSPIKIISIIFDNQRLEFLFQIFLPLGFLSLLSPLILVFALPDLMISLLSNNVALHQIYYQYTAPLTPFIFISAVYGAKYLLNKFKFLKLEHFAFYILFFTILSAYITGPLPGTNRPNIDMFSKQLENRVNVQHFLSSIPKKYSIAASNNLGSHLSRRINIYTLPLGADKADVVIFLLNGQYFPEGNQIRLAENLKTNPNYKQIFKDGQLIAFAKKSSNVVLRK